MVREDKRISYPFNPFKFGVQYCSSCHLYIQFNVSSLTLLQHSSLFLDQECYCLQLPVLHINVVQFLTSVVYQDSDLSLWVRRVLCYKLHGSTVFESIDHSVYAMKVPICTVRHSHASVISFQCMEYSSDGSETRLVHVWSSTTSVVCSVSTVESVNTITQLSPSYADIIGTVLILRHPHKGASGYSSGES